MAEEFKENFDWQGTGGDIAVSVVSNEPAAPTAEDVVAVDVTDTTGYDSWIGTDMMPDVTGGPAGQTITSIPTTDVPQTGYNLMGLFTKETLNNLPNQFASAATGAIIRAGDKYIAEHTIDQNLEYLRAFVPEEQRGEMDAFVDIINQHPDTKVALDAALKDEGLAGVLNIKNSFTGKDGAFSATEFKEMMDNDAYRGFINSALTQTGTEAVTSKDLAELIRRGIALKKDPMNREAYTALATQADTMGVTGLGDVENQYMMQSMADMWNLFRTDPDAFFQNLNGMIVGFVESMGLPEEYTNMATGFLSGTAWATTSLASDFLNGPKGEPGLIDIIGDMGENMTNSGQQYRQQAQAYTM